MPDVLDPTLDQQTVPPQPNQSPAPATPVAGTFKPLPNAPTPVAGTFKPIVTPAQSAPSLGEKIISGVEQSMPVQTAKQIWEVTAPPQDAKEHVISAVGSLPGLLAYRAGKAVVDGAENLIKSPRESYEQAKADFVRTVKDFHNKDYRNLISDASSTTGDVMGLNPTEVPGVGARVRELSEGARPGGNLATPLTKDIIDLGTVAAGGESGEGGAVEKAGGKVAQAVEDYKTKAATQKAAQAPKITPVDHTQFVYKEPTPAPQHGVPVKVASPLDNATINKLPGGKDLTPEAIKTLKQHIGGPAGQEIEVGSTPKNTLLKAVEPVQKTIADTGVKMKQVIDAAPPFKEPVFKSDAWQPFDKDIENFRKELPGGDEERLNATVDKELKSADEALRSTDPKEVLAYRRKLGSQIDWNNIERNPDTPGGVQNATRAKIYHALGDKIHTDIPETVALDKIFQPNLELQSHLDAKLGKAISRNPSEANAQRASELTKGKTQLENEEHNEIVAQNRKLAGLPETDVEPTVKAAGNKTPVDKALDDAVDKVNVPAEEQPALREMLKPTVKSGKVFGMNTSWYDALKTYDQLSPEERSARFSNPEAVRNVLQSEARKQLVKAVVKYGSVGILAHALGVDQIVLKALLPGGSASVTMHADPAQEDKVAVVDKPVQSAIYQHPKIQASLKDIWKQSAAGSNGKEGSFIIDGDDLDNPISVPAGNSYHSETFTVHPGKTTAIFHTHPDGTDPEASDADKKIAQKYGLRVYVASKKGLSLYDPKTDMKKSTWLAKDLDYLTPDEKDTVTQGKIDSAWQAENPQAKKDQDAKKLMSEAWKKTKQ